MAEWSNAADSKSVVGVSHRGFESYYSCTKTFFEKYNGQGGSPIAYLSEMADREGQKNWIRNWLRVRLVNV